MFDTNILITAGIFGSKYYLDVISIIAEEHTIVLSSQIIDELWRVANVKFPEKQAALECFLAQFNFEITHSPSEINLKNYPEIRDKKDYPILASAINADVDVFITNDKDFEPVGIERPEIMRLMDFEKLYID
jgi:putative PIN family toxin of toxin-antitoxin system